MPPAARIFDEIEHTSALAGLIGGAILGAVIGAAIVFTGGAAVGVLAAASAIGAGASLGSAIGQFLGSLFTTVTGSITGVCSPNVFIGRKMAARAVLDFSMCAGALVVAHPNSPIAEGAKTVLINGMPAAREKDALVCGAKIAQGCETVIIGGPTGHMLAVESEVPAWLEWGMVAVGLLSGVGVLRLGLRLTWLGVARVTGAGLLGGFAGGEAGGWLGGKIFGEGSTGQRVMGFVGALVGGLLAGGRAMRNVPRNYNTAPGVDTGQPILFGQKGVSPAFSKKGRFNGADIDDVVAGLKNGTIDPADIPIQYIWVDGQKVVVNNRSLTALTKAGKKPVNVQDMTGKLPPDGPDSLASVLQRLDEMGGKPSRDMPIRAVDGDRNSPAREIVTIPDD